MKMRVGVTLAASACLVLVGCGKGGKEPTGQVAATVNGEEITMIDLRNEMGNFKAPDAKTRQVAERAALEQIVNRKLLVAAAQEQKLDKSLEYVQEKEKLDDVLLLRVWQNKVAKSVPAPNADEVSRFVASNPDLYAARRIMLMEQVRFPRTNDAKLIEALKPLKTMPEVTALLASRKVPFQEGQARMDALNTPPELVSQIVKLPPEEIFVVPQGNLLTVNKIRETQISPVPPQVATQHASQYLKARRTQEAVQRALSGALAAERAKKDAVSYNKTFQPPAKAAAPAKK